MKLEVLGTGCTKCKRLYDNVVEAVKKTDVQAEVVKVEALEDIVSRGVMITPSLFLDGEEVVSGRVPAVSEIIQIITESA